MSVDEVKRKLELARSNLQHFEVLAAKPGLSAQAALAAHNQARSLRAAVTLYEKALKYEKGNALTIEKREAATAHAAQNAVSGRSKTTAAAMIFDKALTWFANVWIGLIAILNIAAIVGILVGAPTLWDGIAKVQEIYSPFNVWNMVAEIVALSPAFGARVWRDRRLKRRAGQP